MRIECGILPDTGEFRRTIVGLARRSFAGFGPRAARWILRAPYILTRFA
jgi:hypothetical protein